MHERCYNPLRRQCRHHFYDIRYCSSRGMHLKSHCRSKNNLLVLYWYMLNMSSQYCHLLYMCRLDRTSRTDYIYRCSADYSMRLYMLLYMYRHYSVPTEYSLHLLRCMLCTVSIWHRMFCSRLPSSVLFGSCCMMSVRNLYTIRQKYNRRAWERH